MALSQSALLEVLDTLKASDFADVIRETLQVILQQLIGRGGDCALGQQWPEHPVPVGAGPPR